MKGPRITHVLMTRLSVSEMKLAGDDIFHCCSTVKAKSEEYEHEIEAAVQQHLQRQRGSWT